MSKKSWPILQGNLLYKKDQSSNWTSKDLYKRL